MTRPTLVTSIKQNLGAFALDVEFDAPEGLTVLFGPSGAGKTAIINAIAGLSRPESGRITLQDKTLCDTTNGTCVAPHRRRLGYIFQEARLFPHMSVRQNLDYGRKRIGAERDPASEAKIIEMLGIGHVLTRRPAMLSGGEKQRVAIGRALLSQPRMILADEPLAALDDARKAEILPYFERLRDELKLPILYVTHSVSELARLANHMVVLRDGKVTRQGAPGELLSDPNFLPGNIRDIGAVVDAKIVAHHDDGLTELDAGGVALHVPRVSGAPGKTIRLRIAGQDVILSKHAPQDISALNSLPGTITDIRLGDGPGAVVALETKAGRVLARLTKRSVSAMGLSEGMKVFAIVKTVSVAPGDIGAPKG